MLTYTKKYIKPVIFTIFAVTLVITFFLAFLKQQPEDTTKQRVKSNTKEQNAEESNLPSKMKTAAPLSPGRLEMLEKRMITLEEAQKRVPVKIALPTYLPKGVTLRGVIIYPAPPSNPLKNFGEISLYYTQGIQIAEYPAHQPLEIDFILAEQMKNLPDQAPDVYGVKHIDRKMTVKGRPGYGDEKNDVADRWGAKLHIPSRVRFDMDGTGEFEYLSIGIDADNHSLDEVLKIAESMEYPK